MITVRVKNKTARVINLASGQLHPFQEGVATQAEASIMSEVLEWLHDEPEPEPEKKVGRPKKEQPDLGVDIDGV